MKQLTDFSKFWALKEKNMSFFYNFQNAYKRIRLLIEVTTFYKLNVPH